MLNFVLYQYAPGAAAMSEQTVSELSERQLGELRRLGLNVAGVRTYVTENAVFSEIVAGEGDPLAVSDSVVDLRAVAV